MEGELIESFGENVFGDAAMQRYLPPHVYRSLVGVMRGAELTMEIADAVAEGMLEWAMERGATHYTHWFQPMNGLTAEKHDAFLTLDGDNMPAKLLTGKALIKGEADGSSFPSGGLRAVFEARGYTTWDCTSPAFVRVAMSGMTVLCIPTAFCSFSGQALDEKTPLLRSMEAIGREAARVLSLMGITSSGVLPMVGGEQEYFLIDKAMARRRKDIIYTGRTLFGAPPAKGQELEDQYYAPVDERVSAFMYELNAELWKVGVLSKTQHNESAPSQFELAPLYASANIATDQNQIIMEYMRTIADRHGFVCLLHEKPFSWVNGSGKHNNWSLVTREGMNLFKRGRGVPERVFLTFFIATLAALDTYPELLRASCSTLSNDRRLGGHEAPPPIISAYIGQALLDVLERVEKGVDTGDSGVEKFTMGVSSLAILHRDDADRNRTSPLAFTGDKFEFRMVGASQSLAFPNTALNAMVASELSMLAGRLEAADESDAELGEWMREKVKKHKRVVFNGNNYSAQWREEAKKRGLPMLSSAVDAIERLTCERIVGMFENMRVLSREELEARKDIMLRSYAKQMHIEALTMLKMSRQKLLHAALKQAKWHADTLGALRTAGLDLELSNLEMLLARVVGGVNSMHAAIEALAAEISSEERNEEPLGRARFQHERVRPAMERLREAADALERVVDKELWPLPSHGELLFLTK